MAEQYKAEKKQKAIAILNDCPTSPLKMRIVADTIRGVEINRALGMLRFSKKAASIKLENCFVRPSPTGSRRTRVSASRTTSSA